MKAWGFAIVTHAFRKKGCNQLKILSYKLKSKSISFFSDTHFCWRVQELRAAVPEILRPLTQLHGWWHLLAGQLLDQLGLKATGPYRVKLKAYV